MPWRNPCPSIPSILPRRESFYWLAILFTFSLGTAAGDLSAEKFGLGYLTSLYIFAGLIAAITLAHYVVKAILVAEHRHQSTNAVLAFWLAYIITRPLGASIGDYLTQAPADGGVGLGTTITSAIFLATILLLVVYLTFSKVDETSSEMLNVYLNEEVTSVAADGETDAPIAAFPYGKEVYVEVESEQD